MFLDKPQHMQARGCARAVVNSLIHMPWSRYQGLNEVIKSDTQVGITAGSHLNYTQMPPFKLCVPLQLNGEDQAPL